MPTSADATFGRRSRAAAAIAVVFLSVQAPAVVSADVSAGVEFLRAAQDGDGHWAGPNAEGLPPIPATAEVLLALEAASVGSGTEADAAMVWLTQVSPAAIEYRSTRIRALAPAGLVPEAELAGLVAARNADGGWGIVAGAASSSLDTARALLALAATEERNGLAVSEGLAHLRRSMQADGGFLVAPGESSSVYATAIALQAFNAYSDRFGLATARARAAAFLRQAGAGEGATGDDFEAAEAAMAIAGAGLPLSAIDRDRFVRLADAQLPDGSWGGDPYATAAAIRALLYPIDSDADGMSDDFEADFGLDPNDPADAAADADDDGLSNGDEAALATDPTRADSDGDGVGDGEEAAAGSDPRDPASRNRRPLVTSTPVRDAVPDADYLYEVVAVDPDGDRLSYQLVEGPAGMSITSDGSVVWRPTLADSGSNEVSLAVDDGRSGRAIQRYRVAVAGAGVDLEFRGIDTDEVSTDPVSLVATGLARVVVRNAGGDAFTGRFRALLFADRDADGDYGSSADVLLGVADFDGSIEPGATASLAVPVSGVLDFVDQPLHAIVDDALEVAETDEVNNRGHSGLGSLYAPVAGAFQPIVEWTWDSPGASYGVAQTPLVAPLVDTDFDGDIDERDVPAVVFVYGQNPDSLGEGLVALRGDTGAEIFHVDSLPGSISPVASAIADIDGDGAPEIVLTFDGCHQASILVYDNSGNLERTIASECPPTHHVSVANLDDDPAPELSYWQRTYEADGSPRAVLSAPPAIHATRFGARRAIDLDLDGSPELLGGSSAYRADGSLFWHWDYRTRTGAATATITGLFDEGAAEETFESAALPGAGWNAVGQMDDDPFPEIAFVGPGYLHQGEVWSSSTLWIFEHDGRRKAGPFILHENTYGSALRVYGMGAPTIADFDGDGFPEIAVPSILRVGQETPADHGRLLVAVYETDGTLRWRRGLDAAVREGAAYEIAPPVTAFDFDGDGAAEVVAADAQGLYILDGSDGGTLYQLGMPTEVGATSRYPTIADVDNDGNAEIVVPNFRLATLGARPRAGITVLGDRADNWTHARRIWNQWAYHVDNIDERAGVPERESPFWLERGTDRAQHGIDHLPAHAAPDLSVSRVVVARDGCSGGATLTARIGNAGALQVGAGVIVEFRSGAPGEGGERIARVATTRPLWPGEYQDVSVAHAAVQADVIHAVVNPDPVTVAEEFANLALLPHAWSRASGLSDSAWFSHPQNYRAFHAIDGDPSTFWTDDVPFRVDGEAPYYEVRFPYPVAVDRVVMATGLPPTGYPAGTFQVDVVLSNGFRQAMVLDETGSGETAFPRQAGVTYVRVEAPAVLTGSAVIAELRVGGAAAEPPVRVNEGAGRDTNNAAVAQIDGAPCDPTANRSPRILSAPPVVGAPEQLYEYPVGASDPDGDQLLYHLRLGPSGMSIDSAGQVRWTPTAADVGTHAVSIAVSDGRGAEVEQAFQLHVTTGSIPAAENHPPVIVGRPPATAAVDAEYLYDADARDADSDALRFALLVAPAGAVIDPVSGVVTWVPVAADEGTRFFAVEANDGRGGSDVQVFTVSVLPASVPVPRDPIDLDGDGFPGANGPDCDDADRDVHPAAPEIPGNGVDDDCNPATGDTPAPDTVTCTLGAERLAYAANELAIFAATARNDSSTVDVVDVSRTVSIAGEDATIARVITLPEAGPSTTSLVAGTKRTDLARFETSGNAPGRYRATFRVMQAERTLCEAAIEFTVLESMANGDGVVGRIQVTPAAATRGEPIIVAYEVANEGNVDLEPLASIVHVVAVAGGEIVVSIPASEELAVGAQTHAEDVLDTGDLEAGEYLAVLQAEFEDGARTLDAAVFTVSPAVEICGNCRDDDGDGDIDYEDADCCAGAGSEPFALRRFAARPNRGATRLKVAGTLAGIAREDLFSAPYGLVLQVRDPADRTPAYCSTVPAADVVARFGRQLSFRDRDGRVSSANGTDRMVVRSRRNGDLIFGVAGRRTSLGIPSAAAEVKVTIALAPAASSSDAVCRSASVPVRSSPRSGLRYP